MGKVFYGRLHADLQALVVKHENLPINGAGPQTLIMYTPANEAGEKDKS
jgi:hypothetical protein